jgi:nucleoside-diphosphate-sugar epimerase
MSAMIHSSYGILKRIGEKYTNSLNGKTVRLWNVYGTGWTGEKANVISDFITMAKENSHIYMATSGEESRQFLYVDDCCKCLNIIMNKYTELSKNEYDVSSYQWVNIKDLAKIVASNFNNCSISSGDCEDDIQRKAVKEPEKDILKYWQPETSIEEGIKKIINLL